MTETVTQLPAVRAVRDVRVTRDAIPVLDTAKFEHMQRIAVAMAECSLVPDSLRTKGKKSDKVDLPMKEVMANCFLVVNQAVRWDMDPFAVMQCVSVIHGKLTYEGKLIAAVLDAKIGVDLEYSFSGAGEQMGVTVGAVGPDGQVIRNSDASPKTVFGTVADWKTTGEGTPWTPKNYQRMLRYRGAREWARAYKPGTMLGVYAHDEINELEEHYQAIEHDPSPPAPTDRPRDVLEVSSQPAKSEETAAAAAQASTPVAAATEPQSASPPQAQAGAAVARPGGPTVAFVANGPSGLPPKTATPSWEEDVGGPGDPGDPGEIPASLDRRNAGELTPEELDWLNNFRGALSGAGDLTELAELQESWKAEWGKQRRKVRHEAQKIVEQTVADITAGGT